jgi:23S rRNA (uracil1939-C5)-methyltransferase
VNYTRQVDYKEAILRETLHRAGRIDWTGGIRRITGPDANYRLRATFHVRGGRLGFVRERSNVVVPIQECSALVPELNAWIPEANKMITHEKEVHAAAAGSIVASTLAPSAPPVLDVNDFRFELQPEAFFQSNRFLLAPFMAEVLEQAGTSPKYVLDLYCGSGFFSIPLARRATEIIGVESSRAAVKQAKKNAKLNSIRNATFVEAEVGAALQDSKISPDLILMNPPRTGAGKETAERIAGLGAARIVYVSCNPSTFAREAAVFLSKGYGLNQIAMIDQFPNTYHIEMAATLELT